ncbi:MAG: hypothetical protein J7L82_01300 [Staphylothermus sp.]|nr:hypothetical protein [Staphylothermus sp.]
MMKNLLGPKDPEGYYVIRAPRNLLSQVVNKYGDAIEIIELGDEILIRTKSRRVALQIVKMFKVTKPQ